MRIKQKLALVRDIVNIAWGTLVHALTGRTPPNSYQSLISAYCLTDGFTSNLLSKFISLRYRQPRRDQASGVLGSLSRKQIDDIADRVRQDGYAIFPSAIPLDVCERLRATAHKIECSPRPPVPGKPKRLLFDRANPIARTYDFDEAELFQDPDVQRLAADPTFLAVSEAYLKTQPIRTAPMAT